MNKTKSIIAAVVIIIIFIVGIFVFSQNNNSKIDTTIYIQDFTNNYAFSNSKPTSKIFYSFTGTQFENELISLISRLNDSKINLDTVENKYNELSKTNNSIFLTNKYNTDFKVTEIEDLNKDQLINKVKTGLSYKNIEQNDDFIFTGELYDNNSFSGYVSRYYFLNCNSHKVINLVSVLNSNLAKDMNAYGTTLASNIDKDCNDTAQITAATLNFSDFKQTIKSNNKIFTFENIGNISFENPEDISNIRNIEEIIVNNLDVDYIYMEETNSMIPLLRLEGTIKYDNKMMDITFWANYLK